MAGSHASRDRRYHPEHLPLRRSEPEDGEAAYHCLNRVPPGFDDVAANIWGLRGSFLRGSIWI
jgi:hypothetical protein